MIESPSTCIYCIDTSSFRELARHYPYPTFIGVYDALESLINQERLVTIEDVLNEYIDEDVKQWINNQSPKWVIPKTHAVIECLMEIMTAYPEFVDPSKTTQEADQPLVALALTLTRTRESDIVVVTQETRRGIPGRELKIPDACQCYEIECINLLRMMGKECWRFNRNSPDQ